MNLEFFFVDETMRKGIFFDEETYYHDAFITSELEGDLAPGDIPYNPVCLSFHEDFNGPLSKGVIPEETKWIYFGKKFNQDLLYLPKSLTYLHLYKDFNKKIIFPNDTLEFHIYNENHSRVRNSLYWKFPKNTKEKIKEDIDLIRSFSKESGKYLILILSIILSKY